MGEQSFDTRAPFGHRMSMLGVLLLGIVQGLTEFLPVSSSGHLVIGSVILKLHPPSLLLDVLLHVGTLLPVLWLYRREVAEMFAALGQLPRYRQGYEEHRGLRLLACVFVGTIPTALMGATLDETFERLFSNVTAVGIALLLTGALLLLTMIRRQERPRERGFLTLSLPKSLVVGIAQGCAITPGISRSGATIAACLLLSVERETAARFSFLLSVPAILGATVLHLRKLTGTENLLLFSAGAAAAAISGYLALLLVVRFVKRGQMHWFAAYVMPLGVAVLSYALLS